MTIRRVTSPDVPEPPPERWSNCLVSDGIAYVAGMTARGTDAATLAKMDEYEQAKQIFGKIKSMVEAAGGTMADVVKRWEEIGAESSTMTPAEYGAFVKAELEKWTPVVKASGAKPE